MSQPSSGVVTSLIEGEAKQKQVFILEVEADKNAPDDAHVASGAAASETVRPFKYRQVSLIDLSQGDAWARTSPRRTETPTRVSARRVSRRNSSTRRGSRRRGEDGARLIPRHALPHRAKGEDEVPHPSSPTRDYSGFSTINAG